MISPLEHQLIFAGVLLRCIAMLMMIPVVRKMFREWRIKNESLGWYRRTLFLFGVAFLIVLIGTTVFQVCRLTPTCGTGLFIGELAFLNSVGLLLAAWFLMMIYGDGDKRSGQRGV